MQIKELAIDAPRVVLALFVGGWLTSCDTADGAPSATSAGPASTKAATDTHPQGFEKHQRELASTEAQANLRKIAWALQSSAATPSGPRTVPMTPSAGSCCKQPEGKCAPNEGDWQHPSWKALEFAISQPHYYSYEFFVDDAAFVARAVGDLDCDGELATLEMRGVKQPDGTYELSKVESQAPLE